MDLASGTASVFAAVGLSGAAGFNASLPLLLSAVLDRLDVVDLGEPFGALSSDAGIAILAALFVADFVGDKVPGVDNVLHIVGTVVHPVAGALLFVGRPASTPASRRRWRRSSAPRRPRRSTAAGRRCGPPPRRRPQGSATRSCRSGRTQPPSS